MKSIILFAEGAAAAIPGGPWSFVVLVLLILFVTLAASEGSRRRDK